METTSSTTSSTTQTSRKQKRSEFEIRAETLSEGAHLFSFHCSEQLGKEFIDQWQAMERKGFFVTTDGCILPYSYYRKSNLKGDILKGHQRAAHLFFGRKPDYTVRTNQHGWPCDEQISHLCHRVDCIRPDHIVIEPRWKNLKRNFCGEKGQCNCGMLPKCLRTYHNSTTFMENLTFETSADAVQLLLAPLKTLHSFKLLTKTHFKKEDEKKSNRTKRIAAKKKQNLQSLKKQKTLLSVKDEERK